MFNRTRHAAWKIFCAVSLMLLVSLPVMAQVARPNGDNSAQVLSNQGPGFHGTPWRDPKAAAGPIGFAAPAGAHLSYFGGPIISNVQVVQVLYGSGTYNAQVAGTTSPTMGNFYSDFTGSGS
jgi:hypothetical protein